MTLFHEAWWLEAVAPGDWGQVTVQENGVLAGVLPFYKARFFRRSILCMPPLTRTLGPLVYGTEGKAHTVRQRNTRIIGDLIDRLPAHIFFNQHLPPHCNPLPFQFKGFSLSPEFVFVINCRGDEQELWEQLPSKTRTMIRHSQQLYDIYECADFDEFYRFHSDNLIASGRKNHFPRDVVARVHAACVARGAGRIFGAYHKKGHIAAAIFVAWAAGRMHFLMLTRAPMSANGVIECLIWQAAALANELGFVFDLDGIPNEITARRMSQFGGSLEQRMVVTRGKYLLSSLRHMRRELRWTAGRREHFV